MAIRVNTNQPNIAPIVIAAMSYGKGAELGTRASRSLPKMPTEMGQHNMAAKAARLLRVGRVYKK